MVIATEFNDIVEEYERRAAGEAEGREYVEDPLRRRSLNTGAILLRKHPWTFEMLRRWHGVGYSGASTEDPWANDADGLTPWGRGFLQVKAKGAAAATWRGITPPSSFPLLLSLFSFLLRLLRLLWCGRSAPLSFPESFPLISFAAIPSIHFWQGREQAPA